MIEESVIYQGILQGGGVRGEARGLKVGVEQGLQQGLQTGLQRERKLLLRMLERSIGKTSLAVRRRVEKLDFDQLEQLGEALWDFKTSKDLSAWLKQHTPKP